MNKIMTTEGALELHPANHEGLPAAAPCKPGSGEHRLDDGSGRVWEFRGTSPSGQDGAG